MLSNSAQHSRVLFFSPRALTLTLQAVLLGVFSRDLGGSGEAEGTQWFALCVVVASIAAVAFLTDNRPFSALLVGTQVSLTLGYFVIPVLKPQLTLFRSQGYHARHYMFDSDDVAQAVLCAALAIGSMLAAYAVVRSFERNDAQRWYTPTAVSATALPPLGLHLLLVTISAFLPRLQDFVGPTVAKFFGGNLGALTMAVATALGGIVVYLDAHGGLPARSPRMSVVLVGVVLAAFVGAVSGFAAQLAAPLVALGFSVVVAGRIKARWVALGIVALPVVIAFMAIKTDLRARSWDAGRAQDFSAAVDALISVVEDRMEGREDRPQSVNADIEELYNSNTRLQATNVLAHVINATPGRVPFWDGETYKTYGWMFVPRLLFPWKPAISFGQDFPHRYGLLDPTDIITSFNMLMLVEAYANFGKPGVVFHYAVLGFLLGGAELLLRSRARDSLMPYGVATYLAATQFFAQESGTFGFAQTFITAAVVAVILERWQRLAKVSRTSAVDDAKRAPAL